jgi:hypothetical protein
MMAPLLQSQGLAAVLYLCVAVSLFGLLFTYVLTEETKHKKLDEHDEIELETLSLTNHSHSGFDSHSSSSSSSSSPSLSSSSFAAPPSSSSTEFLLSASSASSLAQLTSTSSSSSSSDSQSLLQVRSLLQSSETEEF